MNMGGKERGLVRIMHMILTKPLYSICHLSYKWQAVKCPLP